MDFKIIHIGETDSTNRWLRSLGSKEFRNQGASSQVKGEEIPIFIDSLENSTSLVVWAEYQTAGKGCGTNSWESERGRNLTFSVLLHPEYIPARAQFRISEAVSVALSKLLETCIYDKVRIKWPNDIYVGDRKICGILIENVLHGTVIKDSIIGIGLNVNQTQFLSDAPNPVSLCQLLGHDSDREALLNGFLQRLGEELDSETFSRDYRSRLYRKDEVFTYRDAKGEFRAKLIDVLEDGRLSLLDTDGKVRMYAFKEVQFIIEH